MARNASFELFSDVLKDRSSKLAIFGDIKDNSCARSEPKVETSGTPKNRGLHTIRRPINELDNNPNYQEIETYVRHVKVISHKGL